MKVVSIKKLLVAFLISSIILSGCTDKNSEAENNTNTPEFSITFVDGVDTLKVNSELDVIIETNSTECLQFPSDFGVKYFVFLNNTWEEVPDRDKYSGMPTFQIAKKDGYIPGQLFWISPDLSGVTITETTTAKAVINGSYCDDPDKTFSKEFEFSIQP